MHSVLVWIVEVLDLANGIIYVMSKASLALLDLMTKGRRSLYQTDEGRSPPKLPLSSQSLVAT